MSILLTKGEYEVEIITDSFVRVSKDLNSKGCSRITTLRVRLPRIVLAEWNTHRLISRNSASSRAIPAKKMRQRVMERPFVPLRFPLDHTGMQATEWVEVGSPEHDLFTQLWLFALRTIVGIAELLSHFSLSKQLANRLIEPFTMHEILATATEWENFLALRAHKDAQEEIRISAELILEALNQSHPTELQPGDWHMPFGDRLDREKLENLHQEMIKNNQNITVDEIIRMIAVARGGRVSYANFEGVDDYSKDVELYHRLASSYHWSPFEHVACAMSPYEYRLYSHTYPDHTEHGWCGNFRGFVQLRKTYPREVENQPESRLLPINLD